MFGFTGSILSRLALGGAFILSTGVMVLAIERPLTVAPVAVEPRPATTPANHRLKIHSTFAVRAWTVQVLGSTQVATHQDATTWEGTVNLDGEGEVFIQALGATVPSGLPGCLRIRLGNQGERFVWGQDAITTTVGVAP